MEGVGKAVVTIGGLLEEGRGSWQKRGRRGKRIDARRFLAEGKAALGTVVTAAAASASGGFLAQPVTSPSR